MAPLILHNVPDEELYVGDDGIQRPYAMVFPHQDGSLGRSRKAVPETGSFGKSTRRSRSKTGTPARREDPTVAAADRVFSDWLAGQNNKEPDTTQRPILSSPEETPSALPNFSQPQQPTEVILRGYRSSQQQYAAINHYEQLAGRICEDYPRDPPVEARRYKSELRDPAFTRRRTLTAEERAKVTKADSGEHWVKVTFESADAADAAIYASPQTILGHVVYAEPYHGIPPARDEAIPAEPIVRSSSQRRRHNHTNSGSFGSFGRANVENDFAQISPPRSQVSSRTADTATIGSAAGSGTLTADTVMGGMQTTGGEGALRTTSSGVQLPHEQKQDDGYCRRIPTARRAQLLPVEQALLPAPSLQQRILSHIPFLSFFGRGMIGTEIPRTESGDFDWERASLYWKLICWLDLYFRLFGGEILSANKDD
ncbi:hypothetical protein V8F20_000792 [Naviculisporaceae sp. PSN 640]